MQQERRAVLFLSLIPLRTPQKLETPLFRAGRFSLRLKGLQHQAPRNTTALLRPGMFAHDHKSLPSAIRFWMEIVFGCGKFDGKHKNIRFVGQE